MLCLSLFTSKIHDLRPNKVKEAWAQYQGLHQTQRLVFISIVSLTIIMTITIMIMI